jgi:FkbM family methyltransferase
VGGALQPPCLAIEQSLTHPSAQSGLLRPLLSSNHGKQLMLDRLKTAARDALPQHLQVPVKYFYQRVRGHCEAEMALLPMLALPGAHVADVGGNRGIYAYRLRKLGARVEVFEPNPVCAGVLQSWAHTAGGVCVHPVALSSGDGSAKLHIPVDSQGLEHDASASLESQDGAQFRDCEVALRTLDSFGYSDLSFIKIDVEGHESSVLAGASATLGVSKPALLIEIEQRHNPNQPIREIFDYIESRGYRGLFFKGGKLIPINQFDAERDQSMRSFALKPYLYHNNFLFLADTRVSAGDYRQLIERYMAR